MYFSSQRIENIISSNWHFSISHTGKPRFFCCPHSCAFLLKRVYKWEREKEREGGRERALAHRKHSSIHTEGTIVGNGHIHNNLCIRQPTMSLKNTFPCILPMKAKNSKFHASKWTQLSKHLWAFIAGFSALLLMCHQRAVLLVPHWPLGRCFQVRHF